MLNDPTLAPVGRARFLVIPVALVREETALEQSIRIAEWERRRARNSEIPEINFQRLEILDPRASARRVAIGNPDADPEHDILDSGWLRNLIVTAGKGLIMDRLFALNSVAAVAAIGVGGVATAAAATDTQINNGGASGNAVLQAFDSAATRSGLTVSATSTMGSSTANFQWQEFAFFNGLSNGGSTPSTMYNHIAPVGPFTKTPAVIIPVTLQTTQQ